MNRIDIDEIDILHIAARCAALVSGEEPTHDFRRTSQHEEDYVLGSIVTTTAEYEILTTESFTGVVVRGETWDDPALIVMNRDTVACRIAAEFLERIR